MRGDVLLLWIALDASRYPGVISKQEGGVLAWIAWEHLLPISHSDDFRYILSVGRLHCVHKTPVRFHVV